MQGVPISNTSSVNSVYPSHRLQCGRGHINLFTFVKSFLNAVPEWRAVRHPVFPVPDLTKMPMLEPVRNATVPHRDTGCRNADASGIGVNADLPAMVKYQFPLMLVI